MCERGPRGRVEQSKGGGDKNEQEQESNSLSLAINERDEAMPDAIVDRRRLCVRMLCCVVVVCVCVMREPQSTHDHDDDDIVVGSFGSQSVSVCV